MPKPNKTTQRNGVRTGKQVASQSGKLLGNKSTPQKQKQIAGSALVNRKK